MVGIYSPKHPAAEHEVDQGVQVWRIKANLSRFRWIVARYRLRRRVAQWVADGQVEIVDVPDTRGYAAGWPQFAAPVVGRLCGSTSFFDFELGRTPESSIYRLERASLARADYWFAKSKYLDRRTREVFDLNPAPSRLVHNPVADHAPMDFDQRVPKRVAFTGTLSRKKGVVSLVKAWPKVVEHCGPVELHLYGKGGRTTAGRSMEEYLRSLVDDSVNAMITFRGHVKWEQLVDELRATRFAVFPSYAEGFANAPLEAMSAGCATVYSSVGAGPELIENDRTGLLVDPDSPKEIADAVVRLVENPALARRLAEAGKASVKQRFNEPRITSRNEGFYAECIEEFHGQGAAA